MNHILVSVTSCASINRLICYFQDGDADEEKDETSAKIKSKKNKGLGRRSTRTRKHISYRSVGLSASVTR